MGSIMKESKVSESIIKESKTNTVTAKRKVRILLVEDEAFIGLFMIDILRDNGCDVCGFVQNGKDAIKQSGLLHPDLVLMDIGLPGKIDGVEAALRIKKQHNIPIVFITGYDRSELEDRVNAVEPIAYLIKPLVIEELMHIINRYFTE